MRKGKILIIDDSSVNLQLLAKVLKPFGYDLLLYTNPSEAIEKEKSTKIKAAVINLAGVSDFTKQFLLYHPDSPIIYIDNGGQKIEKQIDSTASFVYIQKPFDLKAITQQFKNILNLKNAKDELFQDQQILENFINYTNNEIIFCDLNFDVLSQNYKIFNQNSKINNFVDILKFSKDEENIRLLSRFVNSDENDLQLKTYFEGSKYLKIIISKIKKSNIPSGYLIIVDDITRKNETSKMLGQFIEMLTHDLKTPVRAEERALKLLLDGSFGKLNKEQAEIVKELLNSSRFMLRMTDNILTRYKIDNGECKIIKTSNSIKCTLQHCLENLSYLFEAKLQKVNVNFNIQNPEDEILDYDEVEIRHALTNLISNASEYSPKNSEININVEKDNDYIKIVIKDNGNGIPDCVISNLEKEFAYNQRRFKNVGSGFGLYVVKKIIEAHKGSIQINTGLNSGTSFSICLPYMNCQKQKLVYL